MSTPLLELEGTVEEIQERLAEFVGQRLYVTVRPVEDATIQTPGTDLHTLTIEEKLQARFSQIPQEERAKAPPDLTDNLDHYICRLPKNRRNQQA